MRPLSPIHKKQEGAALIVALVILVIVTVLGVANMNATTNEMRMANSSLKRAEQFAFAERALSAAEDDLKTKFDVMSKLFTDTCGSQCFNKDCDNGYCFFGEYDSSFTAPAQCKVAPKGVTDERPSYWKEETIWSTSSKHVSLAVPFTDDGGNQIDRPAKYIAEFLCFVDNGENGKFGETEKDTNGVPVFRVTVLVEEDEDGNDRVPIMLQSNYILAMK
ncbi:hypothetical protein TDB9533_04079 [Thalassocella blandensis]|nr:hypothetical protein TDB9533_04079 [Thalassocella blandensis]